MRLTRPPRDYVSLDEFHDDLPDVDRRLSPTRDFGEWIETYAPNGPLFTITYVEQTHELIEVNGDNGRVRVLAIFDDADELDVVMQGWQDAGTIPWLRGRLELAAVQYVCGRCVARGRQPGYSFIDTQECPVCGHRSWSVDPAHELVRIRAPKETAALARQHADFLTAKESS